MIYQTPVEPAFIFSAILSYCWRQESLGLAEANEFELCDAQKPSSGEILIHLQTLQVHCLAIDSAGVADSITGDWSRIFIFNKIVYVLKSDL